jgi:type I restriction enzyme S subunit
MRKPKPSRPTPQAAETDLPEGWASATIADITVPKVDQSGPGEGDEFTYVDIASVDNCEKRVTAPRTVSKPNAPSRARQVVRSGDVLVSMTRPNLNAVAFVGPDLNGAIASTGFDVLRSIEVTPGWLFLIIRSQAFIDSMTALVQGALYPAVRPLDVRGFELPIPPLIEQKRIVAKVEALLERTNAARARLAKLPVILKRFRRSVLAAACSGQLSAEWREQDGIEHPSGNAELPASWQRIRLRDVCKGFEYGSSQKSSDKGDVPVLRMGNLQDGKIDWTELKYSSDPTEIRIPRRKAGYLRGVLNQNYSRLSTQPGVLELLPEHPGFPRILHAGQVRWGQSVKHQRPEVG